MVTAVAVGERLSGVMRMDALRLAEYRCSQTPTSHDLPTSRYPPSDTTGHGEPHCYRLPSDPCASTFPSSLLIPNSPATLSLIHI